MKITNRDTRALVMSKTPFKATSIFAESNASCYAVYSYGYHFPMYVCKKGKWYRNSDKYSVTTSKHMGQVCPYGVDCIEKTTEQLKKLIGIA